MTQEEGEAEGTDLTINVRNLILSLSMTNKRSKMSKELPVQALAQVDLNLKQESSKDRK